MFFDPIEVDLNSILGWLECFYQQLSLVRLSVPSRCLDDYSSSEKHKQDILRARSSRGGGDP